MNIVGLDTSTKTGFVVLSDDPTFFFSTELEAKNLKGFERLVWFRKAVNKLLDTYNPVAVVIENYGFANAFTLVPLVEIGTIVRMVVHDRGIPLIEIPPTTLKKIITGKGVAKKEVMLLEVFKRWGFTAATNNVADAYSLAKIGQYLCGLEKFNKAEIAGLEKIESVKKFREKKLLAA